MQKSENCESAKELWLSVYPFVVLICGEARDRDDFVNVIRPRVGPVPLNKRRKNFKLMDSLSMFDCCVNFCLMHRVCV